MTVTALSLLPGSKQQQQPRQHISASGVTECQRYVTHTSRVAHTGVTPGLASRLRRKGRDRRRPQFAKRFRLFGDEEWGDDGWRAMQAAEKTLSRVAGQSMRWNGIGMVISDRHACSPGPGP